MREVVGAYENHVDVLHPYDLVEALDTLDALDVNDDRDVLVLRAEIVVLVHETTVGGHNESADAALPLRVELRKPAGVFRVLTALYLRYLNTRDAEIQRSLNLDVLELADPDNGIHSRLPGGHDKRKRLPDSVRAVLVVEDNVIETCFAHHLDKKGIVRFRKNTIHRLFLIQKLFEAFHTPFPVTVFMVSIYMRCPVSSAASDCIDFCRSRPLFRN